jgi:hypothetical protein
MWENLFYRLELQVSLVAVEEEVHPMMMILKRSVLMSARNLVINL